MAAVRLHRVRIPPKGEVEHPGRLRLGCGTLRQRGLEEYPTLRNRRVGENGLLDGGPENRLGALATLRIQGWQTAVHGQAHSDFRGLQHRLERGGGRSPASGHRERVLRQPSVIDFDV